MDRAWLDDQKQDRYKLGEMNCYCNQIYDLYGANGLKVLFPDGQKYCLDWYDSYFNAQYVSPTLGIWIAITNLMITIIFQFVGRMQKSVNSSATYQQTAFNIFMGCYLNTAIMVILTFSSFLFSNKRIAENS